MPRPQFSLKTLLWLMTGTCGFVAFVALAPAADRLAVAGGLLLFSAPLVSGVALLANNGRSRWVSIVGLLVASISMAVIFIIAAAIFAQILGAA